MKTFFLAALLTTQFVGHCSGGLGILPEVAVPKLTATEVLAIAQKNMAKSTNSFVLVAVDWYKASDFQPRFNDGITYSPGRDDPEGYSWFVTYLYRDEELQKNLHVKRRFNTVRVMRIKDNGQKGEFGGGRP